jgi:hypothetical protein
MGTPPIASRARPDHPDTSAGDEGLDDPAEE